MEYQYKSGPVFMSEKHANTPDVSAHRQLSDHEEDALEAGKKRWLPRIFQSYGTPIPELMASPLKTGLIFGAPVGLLGAGIGSAIGGAMHGANGKGYAGMGALLGGLGAGGLAALAAGMDREAKNEGLEELMRRMPEGAAKRDLLADPQYQSDFLGWDNNKIVATARARYYRPTERFSKRTEDMAGARARYNERHKSSSVNKETIMSQRPQQNEKQALGGLGTTIGALYGAASGNPGDRWRSAGRGAVKGLGWDAGAGMGAGVGALLGMPLGPVGMAAGGAIGGIGGGLTGKNVAGALLGPYETEEAKLERLLAARAKKKSAPPAEAEDNDTADNKKAAHALLNNNTLTLAEKMAAYKALLQKQAFPDRVPFDASSIPGPDTFVPPIPMPPVDTSTPPMPSPAAVGRGAGAGASASPKLPLADAAPTLLTSGGSAPGGPRPSVGGAGGNQPSTTEVLKHLLGVGKRRSTLYDETAKQLGGLNEARKSLGNAIGENVLYPASQGISGAASAAGSGISSAAGALNKARINTGNWLGENVLYPAAKGMYYAPGVMSDAAKGLGNWLRPAQPSLMDQLKPFAPYAAAGGAGLGGLALLHYLTQNKKKKRPAKSQNQDEEYDMPKAANVNWYKLARERQKRAMIPTPYALPMAPAAIKAMTNPSLLARLSALAGRGRDAVSGLPTWAKITGGLGAAGGAGAGIGALGGMFSSKDPSMLQQIMNSKYTPYAAAGLGTAGLLGGAAYLGSQSGKGDAKKKKKPEGEKQSNLALGAGAGAGLGGLAGGLYGALAPGHERDPETGRRRRRSRLMAALRGMAGGAAAGGVAGGALGHFAGGNIADVLNKYLAQKQEGGASPEGSGIKTDVTMQADPVEAAKAEAAKQPAAPATAIPQGPTDFNSTMGASIPPGPGLQNSMPPDMSAVQSVTNPPNPMPSASPAAGMGQGPTSFNSTMGGLPQRPMM